MHISEDKLWSGVVACALVGSTTLTITIVTADDYAPVRAGLRAILGREADLTLLGEAEDGNGAILLAEALGPDVLIADYGMPGLSGIDVAAILRKRAPGVRVLLVSVYTDCGLAEEALGAGAAGYLEKRLAERDLAKAVRAVARGETYASYGRVTMNGLIQPA
jgi:DNA-binding NarL/FixJ family response regulator